MDVVFLFKGLAIGLAIAAPVGPVGVLCINRTLSGGRARGLATGMGVATADAAYASVAAFGLTLVSDAIVDQQEWLRLGGGIFLCYLAVRALTKATEMQVVATARADLASAYGSGFLLTLTNPATILSFAAVFAGLDIVGEGGDASAAVALVVGVFSGSALWWLLLSGGIGAVRSRMGLRALKWTNRLSAAVIGGFGVAALVSLIV